VRDLNPLWFEKALDPPVPQQAPVGERFGLLADRRETLGTSAIDAVPRQRIVLSGPGPAPLLTALALTITFVGYIYDLVFIPVGAALVFASLFFWHMPEEESWDMERIKAGPRELPTSFVASSKGIKPPIWWGMLWLIIIEVVVIAALVASYYYLQAGSPDWPIGRVDPPELLLPTISAIILWATIIPHYLSEKFIQKGNVSGSKLMLVIAGVATAVFLALKFYEYAELPYNWAVNAYTSILWTITGFHAAHVLAVVLKTAVIGYHAFRGYYNEERHDGIATNALYAYFVAGIWLPLYLTLYIAPHLLER
jgi:cytochrome c oxidase subunit III